MTCEWTRDEAAIGPLWETQCGHAFQLEDGGPADHGLHYCAFCGGHLIEVLPPVADDAAGRDD